MSSLVIRNLPDHVHAALRCVSVETMARANPPAGIDFTQLAQDRAAAGFAEDGPAWDDAMDDAALSRRVLGLE